MASSSGRMDLGWMLRKSLFNEAMEQIAGDVNGAPPWRLWGRWSSGVPKNSKDSMVLTNEAIKHFYLCAE